MRISIKRVYARPAKQDGYRVLVDRLWPRGVTKAEARVEAWRKDLAPSNELRAWFHEDVRGRHGDFVKKYKAELRRLSKESLGDLASREVVTFVTAAKDVEASHVPVLKEFLEGF